MARSVEILKELGLVSYFLELSESKYRQWVVAYYQHTKVPDSVEVYNVPLQDSVINECFLLLAYGAVLAITIFLVECLITVVIQIVSMLAELLVVRQFLKNPTHSQVS